MQESAGRGGDASVQSGGVTRFSGTTPWRAAFARVLNPGDHILHDKSAFAGGDKAELSWGFHGYTSSDEYSNPCFCPPGHWSDRFSLTCLGCGIWSGQSFLRAQHAAVPGAALRQD